MNHSKTEIQVYAHWLGMIEPKQIGVLCAQQAKGKKAFSFEYCADWISSKEQILLDPDIGWYKGLQYPVGKENFGIFFDSMPDTWGKTLMKRRALHIAKSNGESKSALYDIDFLLGVYDECRLGALRFKLEPNGDFLDNNKTNPTPPLRNIRELQYAADIIESDDDIDTVSKWLAILIAPGSSLGGARPKANVIDEQNNLWIAKFPSKHDTFDKAAWEYIAYRLAINAGIEMAESRIEKISGQYHTFITKRFDRKQKERIHFASAMTMMGFNEDSLKDNQASYLDIAEFIQFSSFQNTKDLHQLWKRMIFNIVISNTDDHLRNHGFILTPLGWKLSPAFDINPSIEKNGLALNIDTDNNDLDIELAKSVGDYFKLSNSEMNSIIADVNKSVASWKNIAKQIGISKTEQKLMELAFKFS